MNRRNFLKLIGASFFSGLVVVKAKLLPSKRDYICAELQEFSDYSTQVAPFIRHRGIWFFADGDIIKYCLEKDLRWDNGDTIYIREHTDIFDFWTKIEGHLYWVGQHKRLEILINPDDNLMPVRLRESGYWDGENWNNYTENGQRILQIIK